MESDKELLALIQNAAQKYDEADKLVEQIDEYCETICEKQQQTDMILSDLYHEIENDDLSDEQLASFGREIKKYRIIRRNLNNANIIRNVYEKHKNKISNKENRPFFRNSMKQVINDLNQPYKNRVLTDENINQLKIIVKKDNKEKIPISIESSKNNKKKLEVNKTKNVKGSVKIDVQELKKEYLKGTRQRELATIFGCTQPTINYYIKKIKMEEGK